MSRSTETVPVSGLPTSGNGDTEVSGTPFNDRRALAVLDVSVIVAVAERRAVFHFQCHLDMQRFTVMRQQEVIAGFQHAPGEVVRDFAGVKFFNFGNVIAKNLQLAVEVGQAQSTRERQLLRERHFRIDSTLNPTDMDPVAFVCNLSNLILQAARVDLLPKKSIRLTPQSQPGATV